MVHIYHSPDGYFGVRTIINRDLPLFLGSGGPILRAAYLTNTAILNAVNENNIFQTLRTIFGVTASCDASVSSSFDYVRAEATIT
jgi:hypothetical protein